MSTLTPLSYLLLAKEIGPQDYLLASREALVPNKRAVEDELARIVVGILICLHSFPAKIVLVCGALRCVWRSKIRLLILCGTPPSFTLMAQHIVTQRSIGLITVMAVNKQRPRDDPIWLLACSRLASKFSSEAPSRKL